LKLKKSYSSGSKAIFILIILAFAGCFSFLFLKDRICRFLAASPERFKKGVLVVEGWMGHDQFNLALEEFKKGDYSFIITTGMLNKGGFLMGSQGKLVFHLDDNIAEAEDKVYNISVKLKGTMADGDFAHFQLYADSIFMGEDFSRGVKSNYRYSQFLPGKPKRIILYFDNDTYTRYRDRNLIVWSININGKEYPSFNSSVHYYNHDFSILREELNVSQAGGAAAYLVRSGIPDSLVFAVESVRKLKSKTYSNALDVRSWLIENNITYNTPVNVFTSNIHSKRSYVSYKKALANDYKTGIISSSSQDNREPSIKSILYELIGLAYACAFL